MGWDFTAILQCDTTSAAVVRTLDVLEAMHRPAPFLEVARCWEEFGFATCDDISPVPVWFEDEDQKTGVARPVLPTLKTSLWLPEGFYITIARDSVIVYHLLRWQFFLKEPRW